MASDLEAGLLQLERAFWRAAGDRKAYAEHPADDALHIFPGWGIVDREAALEGAASAQPWQDVTIDDVRIVVLGDEAAALIYTARAQRESGPPYTAAISSVYRRNGDAWRLVVHHQTPLAM